MDSMQQTDGNVLSQTRTRNKPVIRFETQIVVLVIYLKFKVNHILGCNLQFKIYYNFWGV